MNTKDVKIDLDVLERTANAVQKWSACNQAWLDTSEDTAAAVVGHVDDDGNSYPVATIDCEQYYSGDSLALGKFYASANPAVVLELIRRLREAESELAACREALKFYADGCHFICHDEFAWDTVSGEPQNFYEDEANTATVEDGSIAKQALARIDAARAKEGGAA